MSGDRIGPDNGESYGSLCNPTPTVGSVVSLGTALPEGYIEDYVKHPVWHGGNFPVVRLPEPKPAFQIIPTDERVKIGENQLTRGSPMSAGFDISVWPQTPITLQPRDEYETYGGAVLVPCGFKLFINMPGVVGLMFARSGSGHRGLVLGNGTGVIDADYQGEWMASLVNRTNERMTINPGDRIGQVVFTNYYTPNFTHVEAFEATERGEGGFGSTGR